MGLTLEEAIALHLEGARSRLNPLYSKAYTDSILLHIETINKAPRNAGAIKRKITKLKIDLEDDITIYRTNYLVTQIEALERLLVMVEKAERGEPLEGIAY